MDSVTSVSAEKFIHAMRETAKVSRDRGAAWENQKRHSSEAEGTPIRQVSKVETLPSRDRKRFRMIRRRNPSTHQETPIDLGAILRSHTEYTALLIETLKSCRPQMPGSSEGGVLEETRGDSDKVSPQGSTLSPSPEKQAETVESPKAEPAMELAKSEPAKDRIYTPDSAGMGVLADAHLETRIVVMPRGGKRILFCCPHCSHRLVVRLRHDGTVCRCEECQGIFRAPILTQDRLEIRHQAYPFDADVGARLLQKQMSLPAHRRRKRIRAGGQLIAAASLVAMLFAVHSMGDLPNDESAVRPVSANALDEHNYADEAIEVVEAFLAADGWEAKSRYVRDPDRVRPLMEDYYTRQGHDDGPRMHTNMRYSEVQFRTPMLTSRVDLEIDHQKVRGFAVEHYPSGPQIEWESHVIYNNPPWKDFLQDKPTTPTTMRVAARLGTYFNFDFNDPQTYLCVELSLPGDFADPVYAYAEKESGVGLEMMDALTKAPPYHWVPVIVDLAFPESMKGTIKQLNILRVRETSWRVPDGGFQDGPDETDVSGPLRSGSGF